MDESAEGSVLGALLFLVCMGALKMRDWKMRDWKYRHHVTGGGKCETGIIGTILQGGGKCGTGKFGNGKSGTPHVA